MNFLFFDNFFIFYHILKLMFDILDGNYDLGNISSIPINRSNSTKKINRPENKLPLKQQGLQKKDEKDDFDSLLDIILNKESKHYNKSENHSMKSSRKDKYESLDQHFEDSSRSKHISPKNSNLNGNVQRTLTANEDKYQNGRSDSLRMSEFGKTEHSILNPSKITESFVSTRNMKPPLRRRESLQNYNHGSTIMGISIPEEDPNLTNSSHQNEDLLRSPMMSKRRSSIDARSQLSDDVFPLDKGTNICMNSHKYDTIKEEGSFNKINKSDTWMFKQKQQKGFQARGKLQEKAANLKEAENFEKKECLDHQTYEHLEAANKKTISYYENQLQVFKNTSQRQINHLQECLDKQIQQNRTMRQVFMLQSNKIIQDQRKRSDRIHQQQISRLKDMFTWQNKKMQDTLQMQISSLKSSLDFTKNHNNFTKNNHSLSQQSLSLLEYQLKAKQQMLEGRYKKVEQRQQQLQNHEAELNLKRKRQEDKLRSQEKRIMELQLSYKLRVLEEKKYIASEKQQLAVEFGNMEISHLKKKEKQQMREKQIQLEREVILKEKEDLQRINSQIMMRHKDSLEEIQFEKQKLKDLQVELMRKLRVVQLKAKELTSNLNNQEDISHKKLNNWLQQKDTSFNTHKRPSVEKKLENTKSMSNISKTKQRFHILQTNFKLTKGNNHSRLNLTNKQNKKIDLSGYMTRIQTSTKYNWP